MPAQCREFTRRRAPLHRCTRVAPEVQLLAAGDAGVVEARHFRGAVLIEDDRDRDTTVAVFIAVAVSARFRYGTFSFTDVIGLNSCSKLALCVHSRASAISASVFALAQWPLAGRPLRCES
ncbi:MAG TPA: hypothetical protein VGM88_04570 [Kofleriaceae bacterium]|jgi:hypothetical protein